MLRSYLIIAWRNIRKNKVFSLINILGLALGMTACLLIMQYVSFELSFDRFHQNADRIYRVVNDRYQNGKLIQHGTITYPAVGPNMKKDFPEVENFTRVTTGDARLNVKVGNQLFVEKGGTLFADHNFLKIFTFPLLAGNPGTALKEAHSLVLTESLAQKYFPQWKHQYDKLLGKTLYVGTDKDPYVITGVIKDMPENSLLQFSMLYSYQTLIGWMGEQADISWGNSEFFHFLLLKPGTDYKKVEARFPAFSQRHLQGTKISGSEEKFSLQPLTKAHLYSDLEYEIGKTGNGKAVWALFVIALFILALAWINYINLATARALERAKEVGVRKMVGAARQQLIGQFLSESVLLNALALLLAFTLMQFAQPLFNYLLGKELSLAYLLGKGYGGLWTPVALITLILTGMFLSGFYPAFTLSAYNPVVVLKGKFQRSDRGILLRKSLVVFQYAASIALIAGTFTVYYQIRYMTSKDLGINLDQILVVYGPSLTQWDSTYIEKANSLKEEVKKLASVKDAATSARLPGNRLGRMFDLKRVGSTSTQSLTSSNLFVDYDFIRMFGIKMLAGREFRLTDHNPDHKKIHNIVINQKAAQLLGFASAEQAVSGQIVFWGKTWDVVGVIADFHQQSLQNAMEPVVLIPSYGNDNFYSFKVSTENLPQTISQIKAKYLQFFPGNTFEYLFLDEQFNKQYQDDITFGRLTVAFSALALLIACLGLLGLSLYAAVQRTKEIGVRKVLGASIPSLLLLLSKDFIRLVLISSFIAWPLAWYLMQQWLQNYHYRIDLNPWLFMLPALLVLVIALFTISFQTIRAARSNPVKALRYE